MSAPIGPHTDADIILAIERAAFERWAQGDVDGFLEASDPEVTYFDPFVERRLDGLSALEALYSRMRGKFCVDAWEILDPQIVVFGDMAVLTFNFTGTSEGKTTLWNTTEVYRRKTGSWRILHTHWSFTNRPSK